MVSVLTNFSLIFLLTSMQCGVIASSDDSKTESDSSADNEMIFSYLRLPWLEGVEWLTHSNESSLVRKAKSLIRGFESGELWAVQMMNNFSRFQREIWDTNIQEIEMHDRFNKENAVSNHENQAAHSEASGLEQPGEQVEYGDFTTQEFYTILFISSICIVMLACTICDCVKKYAPRYSSRTVNTLAQFSLNRNALNLLSSNVTSDTMQAIHGLRFLSCCMIVFGHHYGLLMVLIRQKINILDILEWKNSWLAVCLATTILSVDTFFIISAFLTTYTFLMAKKSGTKFNVIMMYLYRYIRITPCLGILILLVVTLYHRLGSTSLWKSSHPLVINACQENWWLNLLYLQNIVNNKAMCMTYTWYLAADMQLFWISPIILYPLYHWPKIGLGILSLFLIGSVSTSTFLLVVNRYTNAMLRLDLHLPKLLATAMNFYMSFVSHAFPYFSGILLGYVVHSKKIHLTKVNVAISWIATGGLLAFCVWANYKVHNSNFAYDLRMETAIELLLRPSWSVAMAWIIYACTQGYGGIATKFLSLPVFVPLSRLTYCIYLVHVLVQGLLITTSMTPVTLSGFDITYGLLGELILSIAAALALNLFIESPIIRVMKMLSNRSYKQTPATVVKQPTEGRRIFIQKKIT